MKELTLEHLAKRLPYRLKIMIYSNGESEMVTFTGAHIGHNLESPLGHVKPVLHPLDLAKEIEHNGERFVPMIKLACLGGDFDESDISRLYVRTYENPKSYEVYYNTGSPNDDMILYVDELNTDLNLSIIVNKLIEWHFDTDGLIEAGLAVDVNTLDENPYK